jgi:hypothetical protein
MKVSGTEMAWMDGPNDFDLHGKTRGNSIIGGHFQAFLAEDTRGCLTFTSGNFSKPTARASLVPAVLALHWVKVRSSKRAWPARYGFEKFPSKGDFQ